MFYKEIQEATFFIFQNEITLFKIIKNAYAQIIDDYHLTQSHLMFKSDFTGEDVVFTRFL
jgi:hypothetical protein